MQTISTETMTSNLDTLITEAEGNQTALGEYIEGLKTARAKLSNGHSNGHTNGHTNGKVGLKLKLKAKKAKKATAVKGGDKATPKSVLAFILATDDERASTGQIAKEFFGDDVDQAMASLKKMDSVSYHKRGRGGYWTRG